MVGGDLDLGRCGSFVAGAVLFCLWEGLFLIVHDCAIASRLGVFAGLVC